MAELNNNAEGVVLTPVEQAAIVLLSIGEEPAAAVLRCLERDELIELTQVMSRMSGIKVDSVKYAVQNFFDDYREQSGLHGASRTYLKRSLDLALGGEMRFVQELAHAGKDGLWVALENGGLELSRTVATLALLVLIIAMVLIFEQKPAEEPH